MKKFLKATAFMLVMAFMFTLAVPTVMAAGKTGYVKTSTAGSSVNMREKPSQSAKKVTTVKDGTKVEVTAQNGDWYKVTANGKTGYILKTYIVFSSSSSGTSSSGSSSSSSGSTGTAKQAAYVYKTAKAASNNRLTTVKKGQTFPIAAQTTNFYKITVDGKTGYILKKYVTVSSSGGSSSGGGTTLGTDIGVYSSTTISKPEDVVSTKEKFFNAINWNLTQMKDTFTVKVKNFKMEMLPQSMSDLERYFVTSITPEIGEESGGVTPINFTVVYNEAGRVLQDFKGVKKLDASETRSAAIKTEANKYIAAVKDKSDYQTILYIHDTVVKNTAYDQQLTADSYSPYGVLVKNIGSCQGYAETLQLLFTMAGIENRMVWAVSKISTVGTHGFNKVKLDGKWYNVDATVDDPAPNVASRVKHDYFLVTDTVSKQRYSWDSSRYPASSTKNNWHHRNKMTAKSQAELEKLVKAAAAKKEKYVSVWVDDYSASKYSTAFAKKISGVSGVKVTTTPAASSYKTYATALFFQFTY